MMSSNDKNRVESHKYDHDQSLTKAGNLVAFYDSFGIEWRGKDVLDFGCHWGYVPLLLAEQRGAASVTGVDIEAHWDTYASLSGRANPALHDRIRLLAGDILELPELEGATFDLITTAGTLFILEIDYLERVIEWFYDHLRPNGRLLVRTRTILSHNACDYMNVVPTVPYAHLLFPDHELTRYGVAVKSRVPFSGSTYIMMLHHHGFRIEDVKRENNKRFKWVRRHHAPKTSPYDAQELSTHNIGIAACKPAEPFPLAKYWRPRE